MDHKIGSRITTEEMDVAVYEVPAVFSQEMEKLQKPSINTVSFPAERRVAHRWWQN
jgi:hypothetical protein